MKIYRFPTTKNDFLSIEKARSAGSKVSHMPTGNRYIFSNLKTYILWLKSAKYKLGNMLSRFCLMRLLFYQETNFREV